MSEQKNGNTTIFMIVGAAVVLAIVAVLAAVYVNDAPSGNNSNGANSAVAPAAACSGSVELAKAVEPFATGHVAAMASASEPRSLAFLSFNSPQGEKMTVGDMSGKTLLVNLWATWCAPCREEMPALDELQKVMGGEDFEVVAINIDQGDDSKPTAFLEEIGVASLGYYRDNTMGVFNDLKKEGLAFGLPVTLLIDEAGCLVANMNGPAHWSSDDAKAYVGAALSGRQQPSS
ncbi:thiol:disulfide interchange protein TlpA [Hoeflea prorocentri]|uniref:TlpA disulfide reductase family protein n=1 Tax=Hoeflea prorocentri TaxID=1922333 RepID=A0A9X3UNI0_9HYPH|nr:TlpA disulfide reductase family protein [Hoeflea prorocentri]MCY6383645.1 TlpA disulfide reductase family protein [Hoeflea prorocentri]MDA5401445.1 TlpA disulfide reductase family protein [Hoeflea prorocentri]